MLNNAKEGEKFAKGDAYDVSCFQFESGGLVDQLFASSVRVNLFLTYPSSSYFPASNSKSLLILEASSLEFKSGLAKGTKGNRIKWVSFESRLRKGKSHCSHAQPPFFLQTDYSWWTISSIRFAKGISPSRRVTSRRLPTSMLREYCDQTSLCFLNLHLKSILILALYLIPLITFSIDPSKGGSAAVPTAKISDLISFDDESASTSNTASGSSAETSNSVMDDFASLTFDDSPAAAKPKSSASSSGQVDFQPISSLLPIWVLQSLLPTLVP